MGCKIVKEKTSGEEYLIPGCSAVAYTFGSGIDDMTDREIIKAYCSCYRGRKKVEKYEVHTKDEVVTLLEALEAKIRKHKDELEKMENELDCIKSEVFMLNTVEVFTAENEIGDQ